MKHLLYLMGAGVLCARVLAGDASPAPVTCLAAGDGALEARVRGAIDADVHWSNAQMTCEGGMRPGNRGVRVSIAGPLNSTERLRFVFGITLKDTANGVAQALPTNLTVIVEGQKQLFATLGDDKCAMEQFEVTPLMAGAGNKRHGPARQRIHARGYCTGPATDLHGASRVLVSTFEFTSQINAGDEP